MIETGATVVSETVVVPERVTDVQVGAMFASPDGTVRIRMPDHLGQAGSQPVEFPNGTAKECIAGMVRVRNAFAKLRRAQIDVNTSDQQIDSLRKRDRFVKEHGAIHADANKRPFRSDPTWPQISALEQNYDISRHRGAANGQKGEGAERQQSRNLRQAHTATIPPSNQHLEREG